MLLFTSRTRLPAQRAGFLLLALVVLIVIVDRVAGISLATFAWPFAIVGIVLIGWAVATTSLSPTSTAAPRVLASPVVGRWQAINSPTSKVPSHGTHAYAQAFAVDLLALPDGVPHPEFGKSDAAFLPPTDFAAFGEPLLAPADGTVVRGRDDQRDHRSRSSWGAYALFFFEAIPREIRGLAGVLGNHVVIRLDDGTHFLMAHLKRGSLTVAVGDRVVVGQHIADCGNTGNSTEPHVHAQLMDVANPVVAVGLPWAIGGAGQDGADRLPATGETFDGTIPGESPPDRSAPDDRTPAAPTPDPAEETSSRTPGNS